MNCIRWAYNRLQSRSQWKWGCIQPTASIDCSTLSISAEDLLYTRKSKSLEFDDPLHSQDFAHQARCNHLDQIFDWYKTHGGKEVRKDPVDFIEGRKCGFPWAGIPKWMHYNGKSSSDDWGVPPFQETSKCSRFEIFELPCSHETSPFGRGNTTGVPQILCHHTDCSDGVRGNSESQCSSICVALSRTIGI